MPLGSAPMSAIDIDFTRAQGIDSSGFVVFTPPRIRIGATILSTLPVRVEIKEGVGSVNLVRLPFGVYRVREEIDGRPEFGFAFALPVDAPNTIHYEDLAAASIEPVYYTSVKTINGVAPDPVTGNIVVASGGTPPDATSSVKGVLRLTGDLAGTAASPEFSSARITEIAGKYVKPGGGIPESDLSTAVQSLLSDAASSVQPDDLAAVVSTIPTSPSDLGLGNVDNTSDANKPVSTATATAISARSLPDRVVRIADSSKEGAGDFYTIPDTGGLWALFAGPPEYTIPAAIGDDIEIPFGFLMKEHSSGVSLDLVVVTGPTPTEQRYLSSGTSTPSVVGAASNYPNGTDFQGCSGVLGFVVQAGDLDSGNVRVRWVAKSTSALGRLYANVNYPLRLSIRNTRLSGS